MSNAKILFLFGHLPPLAHLVGPQRQNIIVLLIYFLCCCKMCINTGAVASPYYEAVCKAPLDVVP